LLWNQLHSSTQPREYDPYNGMASLCIIAMGELSPATLSLEGSLAGGYTLAYTLLNISERDVPSKKSYWKLLLAGIFVVVALSLSFLRWGGYLLVARNPLPERVDAAVVLQGSMAGERARIATAMAMLQRNSAERVAFSVPKESYWGEEIAPIARNYIDKNYGADLASRVDFCETSSVSSTEQEADALSTCIQEHRWKTIVLVTSNYHSRRAGLIWRKSLPKRDPSIQLSVDSVADPDYQPRGWWRQRTYATTWLTESAKLVWALL